MTKDELQPVASANDGRMVMSSYQELPLADRNEIRIYGCTVGQMRATVEQRIKMRFCNDAVAYGMHLIRDARDRLQHNAHDQMVVMDATQQISRGLWVLGNCTKE